MQSDTSPLLSLVTPWRVHDATTLTVTKVFTLRQRRCESRTNPAKAGDYVFLDANDWVNVVALTPDGQIVMIEQWRAGLNEVTLELAGGIVETGEDPAAAGVRELLEETGYAGVCVGLIGTVSANPAIQNNRVHTVLVRDCTLVRPQQLDGNEEIAVRLVSQAQAASLVRQGIIHHALVVAALFHARLHADASDATPEASKAKSG